MALELPPLPGIDRSRAGLLSINSATLHTLLRLPAHLEIVVMTWGNRPDELCLLLEGAPMPLRQAAKVETVQLIGHAGVGADDLPTLHLSWKHEPDSRWQIHGSYTAES
jgi:hypothetical protein